MPRPAVTPVAALCLLLAPPPARAAPVRLIIDTDMSTDVDDVGAVCIANALADAGEAELLAVVHNTGLDDGAGAISVLNHYYGRDSVPVGAYKGGFSTTQRGKYVDDIVARFPSPIKNRSQVPDAVAVYRAVLAAQPPRSVVISSIGFCTNLAALLASGADAASPLPGRELVAEKVAAVAVMGGNYPDSGGRATWNFGGPFGNPADMAVSSAAANATVSGMPASVRLLFLGGEVGQHIMTGARLSNCSGEENPCRRAYIDRQGFGVPRSSWDPATTLMAVRGAQQFYEFHAEGHNTVDATTGSNAWHPAPPPGGDGAQSFAQLVAPQESVADAIDELLCRPPKAQRAA